MKKTVVVTITKEIEVDIPDEMLTEEAMQEFSQCIFNINTKDELFTYAASYVARFDSARIEGLGTISYQELWDDVETEITED